MALQNEKADAKLAVRAINFLNHLASREAALCNPIRDVLSKWVDGNAIVNAIINNNGGFFDKNRQIALSPTLSNQQPSEDHVYVGSEILSFQDFNSRVEKDVFDIMEFLKNFRPASVDPERLFSFCRLSKNFLQNRLSPENHSRNVFLNKNKHFLK